MSILISRTMALSEPIYYTISIEVDLCLYRAVSERCRGRILPFEVRQIIKAYAWVSFNNETLRQAVRGWLFFKKSEIQLHGDINNWDVSQVTEMMELFYDTSFNDRIDRWDVRNVTSMYYIFGKAKHFNQPLDTWDVSHVTSTRGMLFEAYSFNQSLSS